MRSLAQYVDYLNLAVFTIVAIVAVQQLRAGRGRAALWAALAFGALAFVVDVGQLIPDDPTTDLEWFGQRVVIAVLVVFPYLLYRFTTAFRPTTRRLERWLALMTIALFAWTFLLPDVPAEGEPRSATFIAYLVAFLGHWTVLSIVVAVRLWRAGRGEPGVARRRMQLFAAAATAITVVLLVAAAVPDERGVLDLVTSLAVTGGGLAFLLGLAPPTMIRTQWRRREQRELQDAIANLMGATSEKEVADSVLPPMARIVGARAAALRVDGRVLGSYGATDEMLAEADAVEGSSVQHDDGSEIVALDVPGGQLLVWTSPYAPFFGRDELQLLRTLAALTGLALDRSRLFAQERDARMALERADEVKTNFIALAAHELRTPVATIHGVVETIHARRASLTAQQRSLLDQTLRQQSARMRALVDQLLDLSRLDADAITISPERFRVRERLEELVAAAAGDQADDVELDVAADLEAVADPAAFDRVVTNLVVNAFRYGSPPVTVRAERLDRHFRVQVEDHGPGVAQEFVPDLFERFTRSKPNRDGGGGTGLGLAIARSYAQAHRGDLIYQPLEPNGACFELVLPQDAGAEPDAKTETNASSH